MHGKTNENQNTGTNRSTIGELPYFSGFHQKEGGISTEVSIADPSEILPKVRIRIFPDVFNEKVLVDYYGFLQEAFRELL